MKTLHTLRLLLGLICLFLGFVVSAAHAQNHILFLDGDGDE